MPGRLWRSFAQRFMHPIAPESDRTPATTGCDRASECSCAPFSNARTAAALLVAPHNPGSARCALSCFQAS